MKAPVNPLHSALRTAQESTGIEGAIEYGKRIIAKAGPRVFQDPGFIAWVDENQNALRALMHAQHEVVKPTPPWAKS